jgi:hypothetical protein
MQIKCEQCGHVGEVSEIRQGVGGVELICAECGHANALQISAPSPVNPPAQTPVSEAEAPHDPEPAAPLPVELGKRGLRDDPVSRASSHDRDVWLVPEALKRLVPEAGEGPRCRKCAHLLSSELDHCARCGLNIEESRRWAAGDAPWERAPKGSEPEFERAMMLWGVAVERWEQERLSAFVEHVRESGLHELGIRLLRFHLIEHPEDSLAISHLKELAEALQSRYIVARAQEEISGQMFQEDMGRVRVSMGVVMVVFWGGVFFYFLNMFVGQWR